MTTEYDRLKAQKAAIEAAQDRKAADRHLAEFIEKLRSETEARGNEVANDVFECLSAAVCGEDQLEPAAEVAKTILEILELERIRFDDSSDSSKGAK
jgi:hypothetical protein